jgi:hypothetical protein
VELAAGAVAGAGPSASCGATCGPGAATRTLAAISQALGWEPDHLAQLLEGDGVALESPAAATVAELDELRQAYTDLAGRVAAIERRLDSR